MRSLVIIPVLAIALSGLTACGGGKSNTASNAAGNAANMAGNSANAASNAVSNAKPPDCGAVQAVWVNLNSKVYHNPGDPYYGKTKHGEYLCPSQAKAQGFHPAGGGMSSSNQMTSGRHHKGANTGTMEQSTP